MVEEWLEDLRGSTAKIVEMVRSGKRRESLGYSSLLPKLLRGESS
jgi:hypothetical protein